MTTSSALSASLLLTALACGKASCACSRAVRAGHGTTHCPAHPDRNPSLSVSESNGRALWKCMAGCTQDAVTEAVKRLSGVEPPRAKHLPTQAQTLRFPYSLNGSGTFYHVRVEQPGKQKKFHWEAEDGTPGTKGVRVSTFPLWRGETLAERPTDPVLFVEGEQKAEIAHQHGFLAVSLGNGSTKDDYTAALRPLAGRDVMLLPDNDTTGREYMRHIAGLLSGTARSLRIVEIPGLGPACDVADFFADGGTAEQLKEIINATPKERPNAAEAPAANSRPRIRKARDLQQQGLPPIQYAIEGILPEGVTLMAGRPKAGKSFLALNLGLAIAAGGMAMGDVPVLQGDVLYLTLEGGEHGFLPRLNSMTGGALAPASFDYATEWPRLDDGGAVEIASWLDEHPNARLVIVDTLAKVKAPTTNKSGLYEQDYAAMQSIVRLAERYHVSFLVLHHTRKAVADDPLDTVSGSTGLTGAVDAVWVFQRVRGQQSATLTVSGRNVPDADFGLQWDPELCSWRHVGEAVDVQRSAERQAVLGVLKENGDEPMTAVEVAAMLDRSADFTAVRQTMYRMARSGELLSCGRAGYRLAPSFNEVSHRSQVNTVSHVSQVSPMSAGDSYVTGATGDFRAHAGAAGPARASIEHPAPDQRDTTNRVLPDDPSLDYNDPLCPDCSVALRDGWCPVCKRTYPMEASP